MPEIKYYPLTSPQLSIWYTEKMYPGTSISNIAGTLRFKDEIDFDLLNKAINICIQKNDAMRLRMSIDEQGNPCQYVSEYQYRDIEIIDFTSFSDPIKEMFDWDTKETLKPFELLDSELFRFALIKLGDRNGGIYINIHHLIADAWSISLCANQVTQYYKNLVDNNNIGSLSAQPSYISFIQNEMLYKESSRYIKDKVFWSKKFDTRPEPTALKTSRYSQRISKSKRKTFILPKKFTIKLKSFCAENKISPYPLFLSALAMYINRVTNKEDIIIGTPILNRINQIEKNTVGMFVSTIPLRITINQQDSFSVFSRDVLELCTAAFRHQKYPYDNLLKEVREKFNFSDNLYDIVLSYQNSKFERDMDFSTRWHFNGNQANSLTIHINDRDGEGILIIDYDYQSELFYDKEIEFIHQHMLSLIWHALDNPYKKIGFIEMLPDSEKNKILFDFNDTASEYPNNKTIHQLFEEQVERTPDNYAIIFEDKKITYKELNQKANSLARLIRDRGIKPDDLVGIMINRSIEMIIGMLAVLKAGAAYLPIDPYYPHNRIRFMLEDSHVNLLLTNKEILRKLVINENVHTIDLCSEDTFSGDSENLCNINNANHLAYVIYTSGSTGNPKGAMIDHTSLVNFVYGMFKEINFDRIKSVLSIGSFSFDIFLIESIPALYRGSTIVLSSEEERKDPKLLGKLIANNNIDMIVSTPSQMSLFIKDKDFSQSIKEVYEIVLGGESVSSILVENLKKCSKALILNVYGPTETTVVVTTKELTGTNRITIGKPIINTKIYILDKNLLPVPIGIEGEVYIGGIGLARGYNNRSDLTQERFIQSPFLPSEKLYKTGDLARWFPEGEIEYLGRTDFQVKIRGLRIELGEIEKRIMMIEQIKKAVVTVVNFNDNKVICAYYISSSALSNNYIKNYLNRYLPHYMVPSYFVRVDNLPLSPNGKIDLQSLPKPSTLNLSNKEHDKPRNAFEQTILDIWCEVLKQSDFGIKDEFFDIGGDSLSIIQIAARIYSIYDINIPISTMNEISTVEKMADYIMSRSVSSRNLGKSVVKLKEGKENFNLFLVHAGNGEISCYTELSNLINNDFNVWAFRFDDEVIENMSDIKLVASLYVESIKKIQPKGPYLIGGWCIGGTISFEMARILENNNEKIKYLGLFNSLAPQNWEKGGIFTETEEKILIKKCLAKSNNLISGPIDLNKAWDFIFDSIVLGEINIDTVVDIIPKDIKNVLPNNCYQDPQVMVKYLRRIIVLHKARANYYPENKIQTQVVFYSALEDRNIKNHAENIKKWQKYCNNPIINYKIKADHFTLLTNPSVQLVSEITNNYLLNAEEGSFING